MPRVPVNRIRLTDHARERIYARRIPHDAIWGALDHPFSTQILPDGLEVRTVPATVRSRWTWVSVVLGRLKRGGMVVITAYARTRRRTQRRG